MKPREPRRKVLIDARLRHERGWSDARILNISRRGLMARAPTAPPRGTYVEICRGTHRIVARVVWVEADRFGAQAQESIALDALASGADTPAAPATPANDGRLKARIPTSQEREERSRRWSQRLEFIAVTAFGCGAAFLVFDGVRETLSKPLSLVEAQLAARR